LHMGPFVTAVVPPSILLIEDVITDYVETIHLFAAWLRNHEYNSRAGRFRCTSPPVFIGWNRTHYYFFFLFVY
jgi:hypothetical protein